MIAKRKKERLLPIPDWLLKHLNVFIKDMCSSSFGYREKCIVFPMGKVRWERAVKYGSEKLRFDMKVTPHILRHACGTYLGEQGFKLKEIKEFMGHSSTRTTEIYVHINKEDLNKRIIAAQS